MRSSPGEELHLRIHRNGKTFERYLTPIEDTVRRRDGRVQVQGRVGITHAPFMPLVGLIQLLRGRNHPYDDPVRATYLRLPQARQTYSVLGFQQADFLAVDHFRLNLNGNAESDGDLRVVVKIGFGLKTQTARA